MRLKGILLTLVIVLCLLFAITNWSSMTTNLPINVFFLTFTLPLGLSLLALVIAISGLFFAISLFDRAGQLRQITQLERSLEAVRNKLEQKRLAEFESLENRLAERFMALGTKVDDHSEKLEALTQEAFHGFEQRSKEALDQLQERVLLVRNELAADIAEAEDALKREVKGERLE